MKLKINQIIELDEAKECLIQDLTLRAVSDRPQKMILLEGVSGCGKTTLIKAAVEHFKEKYPNRFEYMEVKTSDVTEHVTTTAKKITHLFTRIRELHKPVIMFVDEADDIFASRMNAGHIKSERTTSLMLELNNEIPNLLIIAATNRPRRIDRAVLERFTERINCPYPTNEGIKKLIDLHLPFIDEKLRNSLQKLMICSGLNWSGRDMELMAEKLLTYRDFKKLTNPAYELSVEDVAHQYDLRINSKKHLKDDYLEE